ncbi:hypothetical protein [Sphingomonas bacterium]|uniref:hypothetical protein n=1 Tax=Sphingomonas bacterium TaxID=1895847 RepID=UPI0015765892|nr:hypothetical protein [Sphingomonas bacterium]
MLPLLLLLADTPDLLARAHDVVAPPRCGVAPAPDPTPDEVTVCGARRADRFRVPFTVVDPGDPAHEAVMAERTRLLHRTSPLSDLSLFEVGGGMAGVSITVGGRGTGHVAGWRPLAP